MSWWTYSLLLLTAVLASWVGFLLLQLRRARRAARTSERINDRLFASIGHEVRTPMTGIVGMTGLLQQTELTPRQRRYLRTLRKSSESLLEIIEDVVDFGKIESQRLQLEHAAFDLRACVEEALGKVAAAAAGKGLELAYWIEDGTPKSLIGDEHRVGRILATLLTNGVKLTESGEVTVEVSAAPRGQAQEISFSVRDTGIGWRPDDVDGLLEPCGRGDAELSRRYGGIGLGLAVCTRLAELMGGRLWLAETGDTGSLFCFTIRAEPAPGADRSGLYQPHPALGGKRVLAVAGNPALSRQLRCQVEMLGMRPQAAGSAAEALEQLGDESRQDANSFDLAIVDRQTVAKDGLGWAERLDQECRRRGLPVVQLAAPGGEAGTPAPGRSRWRQIGKPLRAVELYESLLELVADGEPDDRST